MITANSAHLISLNLISANSAHLISSASTVRTVLSEGRVGDRSPCTYGLVAAIGYGSPWIWTLEAAESVLLLLEPDAPHTDLAPQSELKADV